MIDERQMCAKHPRLQIEKLRAWIEAGLIEPERSDAGYTFDDADVARVALMCDLSHDMGIGDDALPLLMSLIDQLHTTRHSLRALTAAVSEQPDDIRFAITSRTRIVLQRQIIPNDG